MIALLRTLWSVSAASFAEAAGIALVDVERELGGYLSATINDFPAIDESDGWATCLHTPSVPPEAGRVLVRCDWRVRVSAASWLDARRIALDYSAPTDRASRELRDAAGRPDLLDYLVRELYSLPMLCETDATMTAVYRIGRDEVRRTFQPDDRLRA